MNKILKKLFPKKEPEQRKFWVPFMEGHLDLLNDEYHVKAYIKIYELGRWSPPYIVVLSSKKRSPSKDYIELGDFYLDQIPPMVKKFSSIRIVEILEELK